MSRTHTAFATTALGQSDVIQVPTEEPGAGEVLIKVEYAAMIPADNYRLNFGRVEKYPLVLGYGAAGFIVEIGEDVHDFKVGDRVTAYAYLSSKSKAMQEYSVQPVTTCAKIPDALPLAEASTIPDNFVCAFHTLFNKLQLDLPIPHILPDAKSPAPLASKPILIYGAGSTAGQFLIQILHAAGYTNIIATGSTKNHEYLRSLGATHTIAYDNATLTEDIAKAAGDYGKVSIVVDCICVQESLVAISKVISSNATVALLLPVKVGGRDVSGQPGTKMLMELPEDMNPFPEDTKVVGVRTFFYQEDQYEKENLMPKILPAMLEAGFIKPNRVRLLDQGTFKERVIEGLNLLSNNKISGEKVVVKVTT